MKDLEKAYTYPRVKITEFGKGEILFQTYIRIKGRDGKWYLQYNEKRFFDSNISNYLTCLQAFIIECHCYYLFGEVGNLDFIDPTSNRKLYELDENQYSERGTWYLADEHMFPKSEEHPPHLPYKEDWEFEVFKIWNDKIKTKHI